MANEIMNVTEAIDNTTEVLSDVGNATKGFDWKTVGKAAGGIGVLALGGYGLFRLGKWGFGKIKQMRAPKPDDEGWEVVDDGQEQQVEKPEVKPKKTKKK